MKIVALRERENGEKRVAITPHTASLFRELGHDVWIENNIGINAGFTNDQYVQAGAKISNILLEILGDADVILKVRPSPVSGGIDEISSARVGAFVIGIIDPYRDIEYIKTAIKRRVSTLALKYIPKITATLPMDAIDSQENLMGYRAIIEGLNYLPKLSRTFTSASCLEPAAKILVIGSGPSAMQAVAQGIFMGSDVNYYILDESSTINFGSRAKKLPLPLDAHNTLININSNIENLCKKLGAESKQVLELKEECGKLHRNFLKDHIDKFDLIIVAEKSIDNYTPLLVNNDMQNNMRAGSVIIDLFCNDKISVEGAIAGKVQQINDISIIGADNYCSKIAYSASNLYAKCLFNLIKYATEDDIINHKKPLVKPMVLNLEHKILNNLINID